MKSKTMTAMIIAAALVILTYLIFFNNKKQEQPFNLVGEWSLDSMFAIHPGRDSLLAILQSHFHNMTNKPTVKFTADSNMTGPDGVTNKYYLTDSFLYVNNNNGKGYIPDPVKIISATHFEFVAKDSIVFVLKKK